MGRKHLIIRSRTLCLQLVALFLQRGKHAEVDVEHIVLRPYLSAVCSRIAAIGIAVGCQLQWNLIFVVIALVIATQTDEYGQLVIFQCCLVGYQMIGMHEHLHAFVVPQVVVGILVNGL